MAGSDELCALLLSPTLSGEIDAKLGELAKEVTQIGEGKQLDLVLAYSLLVNHNMDSFTISMESLWQSFKQITKPISGIEPRARFMAAVAQVIFDFNIILFIVERFLFSWSTLEL